MWSVQARLWGRQNEGDIKTYPEHLSGLWENLYARPVLHPNRVCVIGALTIHSSSKYALTYSACALSCVRLFVTPWTVAHQTLLFLEFSRQEYWSGLPFPPPADLPDPGNPHLLPWQVDSLPLSHWGTVHLITEKMSYSLCPLVKKSGKCYSTL